MHLDGGRRRGVFITLEGPEGSGKSTQARLLAERLTALGLECVVTREPGGTALGESVRQILLHDRDLDPVPAADALLFNAARAQLVAQVIEPALARGEVVICDRFADSTLAYQGYGSGQALDGLRALQRFAIGDLQPDLTVLIDLPVEVGLTRKHGGEITRFEEREDVAFHRRVRDGFLALAAAEPARFEIVDGTGTVEGIAAALFEVVARRLGLGKAEQAGSAAGAGKHERMQSSEPESGSMRMNR
jgi:dTMP kinase